MMRFQLLTLAMLVTALLACNTNQPPPVADHVTTELRHNASCDQQALIQSIKQRAADLNFGREIIWVEIENDSTLQVKHEDYPLLPKAITRTGKLSFWPVHDNSEIGFNFEKLNVALKKAFMKGHPETLSLSFDPVDIGFEGIVDPTMDTIPNDSIALPNEYFQPLYELAIPNIQQKGDAYYYGQGPVFLRALEADTAMIGELLRLKISKDMLGPDVRLVWGMDPIHFEPNGPGYFELHALDLDGDHLEPSYPQTISNVQLGANPDFPSVLIEFDGPAVDQWTEMTDRNINRNIAMLIDNAVVSYPYVEAKITAGITELRGDYDLEKVQSMCNLIKSAHTCTVRIVEKADQH